MPNYSYQGFTKDGRPIKGTKEAVSKQAALAQLGLEGLLISGLEEKTSSRSGFFRRNKNLADLFFQLSLLLRSGIPLVNALEIILRSSSNKHERETLQDIISRVSEGMRFSEALSRHEEFFTSMYVNLVRASENVGRLAQVLMDIAEYEETKKANKDKLVSAIIYPAVVLFFGLGIIGLMLAFVVPKMQAIFATSGQELPGVTQLLLGISTFTRQYGLFIILFAVFSAVLLRYLYGGNQKFRMKADTKLYRIPLMAQSVITRFSHILAFQLREGLPLGDALSHANATVQNTYLKKVLDEIRMDVLSGVKFSMAVKNAGIFPELFPAAVATGESSGNMPELLERVSEFYGRKINKMTENFLSIIQPALIIVIGGMVAFIVISIMLPLTDISAVMGG